MASITVLRLPPPVQKVTIELSAQEATALCDTLGANGYYWKGATPEQVSLIYRLYGDLCLRLDRKV